MGIDYTEFFLLSAEKMFQVRTFKIACKAMCTFWFSNFGTALSKQGTFDFRACDKSSGPIAAS